MTSRPGARRISAFATHEKLVLGQEAVEEKSNEIKAIPRLLERLAEAGALKEDLARLRKGHGAQNMAVVKHMAMNLVRNPKDRHSLKARRKLANLNHKYLESLIRQNSALT